MTYPGAQPDPQQPHQPQPYGQQPGPHGYGPPTGALPSADGGQRGGKWALIAFGGLLLVVLMVVGGYFTFQKVFVDTPTEVVEAYLKEATKDDPDPARLERYLCRDEATKLRKALSKGGSSSSSAASTVLDWHVTGETVNGNTATVYTQFTIKSSSSRTSTNDLNLTLVKEERAWKICGYEA
ncbi:hypothetical protein [Dactylosporangium sp. CA-233914]|uniref:hypothetical protein n=1 Tax=Dactylosporangium sp. CA-233914 TaxID=3239934 RepID=UPI003D924403